MPTSNTCSHTSQIRPVEPQAQGCQECIALGDTWVQLRECLTCGHIGCCDSSKGKHATAHYHQSLHPIMRSYLADDDWAWCYVDQQYLRPVPQAHAA